MPKALAGVDWSVAQALYLQGQTTPQIAETLGVSPETVRQRVTRGKWSVLRDTAKAKAVGCIDQIGDLHPTVQDASSSLGKQSETAKSLLASHIVATLELMPAPTSFSDGAKNQAKVEPTVRNAKTLFGWGEQGQSPLVRINVVAGSALIQSVDTQGVKASFSQAGMGQVEGGEPLSGGGSVSQTPSENFPTPDISTPAPVVGVEIVKPDQP